VTTAAQQSDLFAAAVHDTPTLPIAVQPTAARRTDVLGALEAHEEVTRRSLETMNPARAGATWQAVWALRLDVAAALDRCEAAEAEAKWASDE
jgi:hypothetical protein